MNIFLENKLPQITALLKKHHITQAFVFGSATNDTFNDASDVDFLVSIDETLLPEEQGEHLLDLQYDLAETCGRKVDLLTERSLHNPYLIKTINENKILIYDPRNEEVFV